jgi:BlaI family transcriptional regulator, penicillinase repressor
MTPDPINVTDAELSVLEVLWDRGATTIGEITEAIYRKKTTSRYATVQKLLERLEAKGCVTRDRSGFAHHFAAAIERQHLIGQRLQDVAEKLCDGSLTPLLVHLVETTRLSAQDRKRLRKLIDDAS